MGSDQLYNTAGLFSLYKPVLNPYQPVFSQAILDLVEEEVFLGGCHCFLTSSSVHLLFSPLFFLTFKASLFLAEKLKGLFRDFSLVLLIVLLHQKQS